MKLQATFLSLLAAGVVAHGAQDAEAERFDLYEVARIVSELEPVVPKNPNYQYPITIDWLPWPGINAGAGFYCEPDDIEQKVKKALVCVTPGLLEQESLTEPHLRAILAHEMAHLSLGHSLDEAIDQDMNNVMTRQEELEADRVGAEYLAKIGHDPQEMVDAILWLGARTHNHGSWVMNVAGDHASPVMRASLLVPNDDDLAAIALYEHGLMYLECGQHGAALPFFDQALAKQPDLYEAAIMGARAALQNYYEHLPLAVQRQWLRPDFGPMLTRTQFLAGRGAAATAEDLVRYENALSRIDRIPDDAYMWFKAFLHATAQVLHPSGDEGQLAQGVASLKNLHGQALLHNVVGIEDWTILRQRYANNLALGLARQGQNVEARSLLLTELDPEKGAVPMMPANLSVLPLNGMTAEQVALAVRSLAYYLATHPTDAFRHGHVADVLRALGEREQVETPEIEAPEAAFYAAVEAKVGEREIGLFDPMIEIVALLGDPVRNERPVEKYPDLGKLTWGDGEEVLALVERGRLVRLSSKRPGDAVLLKPRHGDKRDTMMITVGMSESDLRGWLDPAGDGGIAETLTLLTGATGFFELWSYFPTLNMGVMFRDGKVHAVTVTPVQLQ